MTSKENYERVIAGLREATRIAEGYRPTEEDLAGAPLLSEWVAHPALDGLSFVGVVTSHPKIADGHLSRTSVVLAVDVDAGWVRTVSRYYRLGPQRGEKVQ